MEFLTQHVERWLWRDGEHGKEGATRLRLVGRYAFALLRDLLQSDLSLRAMSLVYTTILSIVPLLAFAFSVLKGLGFHRDLEPLLLNFMAPLGPQGAELTRRVIGFVDNVSGSTLASVSIVILLFSALSMAQKVEGSFNYVWRVDRPRSFTRRFSEYLSVMFVGPMLMTVAMGVTAALASAAATSRLRQIEPVGDWLASLSALAPYAMVIAGFSFLYVFVPNTKVRLVPALVGGLFAGALWAGGGSLFTSFVVSASRTAAIYSGFAIVIVAMLWLHLSWLILLLGAQLAFYVQHPEYLRLGQRTEPPSNALRERLALAAMLLVGRDFDTPGHGWRISSLAASLRVPRHMLEPVIASLMHAGLLARTNEQRLVPARDPRRIEALEIVDAVRSRTRDAHGGPSDDWNPTVSALCASVEEAIQRVLAGRTLADLVDTDRRTEAAAAATPSAPAQEPQAKS